MGIGICVLAIVGLVVVAELGRTLVARVFKFQPERYPFKLMKLPGTRGSSGFRLSLILAGPVAGYLAISAVAFGYHACYGEPGVTNLVEATAPEHDAAGKLHAGDAIVEVDGAPFPGGAPDLSRRVNAKRGAPITLTVERDGSRRSVTIEPHQIGAERWVLGVTIANRVKDTGRAFRRGITYPITATAQVFSELGDAFTGKQDADPGGPVRIVTEFRTAFESEAQEALGLALIFGMYALLALAMFDLVRALLLILFRSS